MILVKCDNCGKEFECQNWRLKKRKHIFCSRECSGEYVRKNNPNYVFCEVCGKKIYCEPSYKEKTKHICCSLECSNKLRKTTYKGVNNPQYGLKGNLNASWKSDEKITYWGYKKIRVLDHPFRDCDDFVFEHRLVAEKYLLNEENSIEINGKRYLKKDYIVHHKNHNRLDNRVENLEIMTLQQHTSMHKKEKSQLQKEK